MLLLERNFYPPFPWSCQRHFSVSFQIFFLREANFLDKCYFTFIVDTSGGGVFYL